MINFWSRKLFFHQFGLESIFSNAFGIQILYSRGLGSHFSHFQLFLQSLSKNEMIQANYEMLSFFMFSIQKWLLWVPMAKILICLRFWPIGSEFYPLYSKACYCTIFGPRKTPCSPKSCYPRLMLISRVYICSKKRAVEAIECKRSEPCYISWLIHTYRGTVFKPTLQLNLRCN